jgi:CxxC-x17-CxxC domain-containing protein
MLCEVWRGVAAPDSPADAGTTNGGCTVAYQGGGGDGRPRESHKATCGECKKECEVPFKPSGDRPVYCKACFAKRKGSSR